VDLRTAFGDPSRQEITTAVAGTLLPDLERRPFVGVLEEAAESTDDVDQALALVTALVLTSPEYQLV